MFISHSVTTRYSDCYYFGSAPHNSQKGNDCLCSSGLVFKKPFKSVRRAFQGRNSETSFEMSHEQLLFFIFKACCADPTWWSAVFVGHLRNNETNRAKWEESGKSANVRLKCVWRGFHVRARRGAGGDGCWCSCSCCYYYGLARRISATIYR